MIVDRTRRSRRGCMRSGWTPSRYAPSTFGGALRVRVLRHLSVFAARTAALRVVMRAMVLAAPAIFWHPTPAPRARLRPPRRRQPWPVALLAYRWEQGLAKDQELRVALDVAPGTSAEDVDLELKEDWMRLAVNNEVRLEGELWSSVDTEETYYELEDRDTGRVLVLYLAKNHVETWEEVLRPRYSWEPRGRHNEEIRIYAPVAPDLKSNEVDFTLSYGRIRLSCRDEVIIDGELWGAVDAGDYEWMIEDHEGQRCVVISLGKLHVRENWERLLRSEEGQQGWETFKPGSRKDVDMAMLGSLEYVNSLLHQRDVQYARDYLDYILPPEDDDGQSST